MPRKIQNAFYGGEIAPEWYHRFEIPVHGISVAKMKNAYSDFTGKIKSVGGGEYLRSLGEIALDITDDPTFREEQAERNEPIITIPRSLIIFEEITFVRWYKQRLVYVINITFQVDADSARRDGTLFFFRSGNNSSVVYSGRGYDFIPYKVINNAGNFVDHYCVHNTRTRQLHITYLEYLFGQDGRITNNIYTGVDYAAFFAGRLITVRDNIVHMAEYGAIDPVETTLSNLYGMSSLNLKVIGTNVRNIRVLPQGTPAFYILLSSTPFPDNEQYYFSIEIVDGDIDVDKTYTLKLIVQRQSNNNVMIASVFGRFFTNSEDDKLFNKDYPIDDAIGGASGGASGGPSGETGEQPVPPTYERITYRTFSFTGDISGDLAGTLKIDRISFGYEAIPDSGGTSFHTNYSYIPEVVNFNLIPNVRIVDPIRIDFFLQNEKVQWMSTYKNFFIMATDSQEYTLQFSNYSFSAASFPYPEKRFGIGAADITPVSIGNSLVWVESDRMSLRQYVHQSVLREDEGSELNVFARHLFDGKVIKDIAHQLNMERRLWVLFEDGTVCAAQFDDDNRRTAWFQVDFGYPIDLMLVQNNAPDDIIHFIAHKDREGQSPLIFEMAYKDSNPLMSSYKKFSFGSYEQYQAIGAEVNEYVELMQPTHVAFVNKNADFFDCRPIEDLEAVLQLTRDQVLGVFNALYVGNALISEVELLPMTRDEVNISHMRTHAHGTSVGSWRLVADNNLQDVGRHVSEWSRYDDKRDNDVVYNDRRRFGIVEIGFDGFSDATNRLEMHSRPGEKITIPFVETKFESSSWD